MAKERRSGRCVRRPADSPTIRMQRAREASAPQPDCLCHLASEFFRDRSVEPATVRSNRFRLHSSRRLPVAMRLLREMVQQATCRNLRSPPKDYESNDGHSDAPPTYAGQRKNHEPRRARVSTSGKEGSDFQDRAKSHLAGHHVFVSVGRTLQREHLYHRTHTLGSGKSEGILDVDRRSRRPSDKRLPRGQ